MRAVKITTLSVFLVACSPTPIAVTIPRFASVPGNVGAQAFDLPSYFVNGSRGGPERLRSELIAIFPIGSNVSEVVRLLSNWGFSCTSPTEFSPTEVLCAVRYSVSGPASVLQVIIEDRGGLMESIRTRIAHPIRFF